jgi:hypothetical protein
MCQAKLDTNTLSASVSSIYIHDHVPVPAGSVCVFLWFSRATVLRGDQEESVVRPARSLPAMTSANKAKLQLQERVPLPRTAWKLADLAVLSLLLALLARRASSLVSSGGTAAACTWCWVAALICEAWFTVVWLLNMNAKWNPVRFVTHPERLAGYW